MKTLELMTKVKIEDVFNLSKTNDLIYDAKINLLEDFIDFLKKNREIQSFDDYFISRGLNSKNEIKDEINFILAWRMDAKSVRDYMVFINSGISDLLNFMKEELEKNIDNFMPLSIEKIENNIIHTK